MTGVLGRLVVAAALLGLSACGVSPEDDPQPLPTPSPAAGPGAAGSAELSPPAPARPSRAGT